MTAKTNPSSEKTSSFGSAMWELVRFAIIALIIVIPIRMFIAEPVSVEGTSMVPTFQDKDYLIVDEISYVFNDPDRGDVIVFEFPGTERKLGHGRLLIKRVIGLPSETVTLKNNVVTITNNDHPQGFVLDEPYLDNSVITSGAITTILGDDEYFVMGDNRPHSSDSRSWGSLHQRAIVGRAMLRMYPFQNFSFLPGHLRKYSTE
ncbi:MAG: signal peptidase I [Candidatus Nomurabacteria bacterium]|nr:signal peptidase I [Candidatus Nomurabacteria bacterium]